MLLFHIFCIHVLCISFVMILSLEGGGLFLFSSDLLRNYVPKMTGIIIEFSKLFSVHSEGKTSQPTLFKSFQYQFTHWLHYDYFKIVLIQLLRILIQSRIIWIDCGYEEIIVYDRHTTEIYKLRSYCPWHHFIIDYL